MTGLPYFMTTIWALYLQMAATPSIIDDNLFWSTNQSYSSLTSYASVRSLCVITLASALTNVSSLWTALNMWAVTSLHMATVQPLASLILWNGYCASSTWWGNGKWCWVGLCSFICLQVQWVHWIILCASRCCAWAVAGSGSRLRASPPWMLFAHSNHE